VLSLRKLRVFLLPFAAVVLILSLLSFSDMLTERLSSSVVSAALDNKPLVIIDPGHGGIDGGAQANGICESELNLAIALKTAELCRAFGFNVIMTRDSDISIHDDSAATVRQKKNSDLRNRLRIMTDNTNAAVISIHLNKFQESYVHGAQVFYAPNSLGSNRLAEIIQKTIKELIQPDNNRETKQSDSSLYILYNNKVNPAVMVECGFISNPQEALLLKDSNYQDKLAFALLYSLIEFYNKPENTNSYR